MFDALALTLAQDEQSSQWLLRLLNVSSYAMLPWIILGLAGQLAFFLRMAVQWIASEKSRRSVIPTVYWWLSLGGGLMLLAYFLWRKDIVGVLGQSMGTLVYSRNLRLIHHGKKQSGRSKETPEPCCPLHQEGCPLRSEKAPSQVDDAACEAPAVTVNAPSDARGAASVAAQRHVHTARVDRQPCDAAPDHQ